MLGVTTPGIAVWDRDHVEGRFEFRDMIASARIWLDELEAHEPDLVVLAAHSGIEPGSIYGEERTGVRQEAAVSELVRTVDGIDVAFAGHTAGPEPAREIDGTLVVHAGHWGETLAAVQVTLERRLGGRWTVTGKRGRLLDAAAAEADSDILDVVRPAHEATRAWLDETLAHTPDRWTGETARVKDSPIVDLITTAMRAATDADLASTAIFDPSVSFEPGPIRRRDVLRLYRYPNRLKVVRIDRDALEAYLEWSARYYNRFPADDLVNDSVIAFNYDVVDGVEYRIDLRAPAGSRIRDLRFGGEPLGPDDTLSLAVNSYRQAGGGGFGMLGDLPVTHSGRGLVSELIVDFISERDTLRTEDVHRVNWTLEPDEAVRRLLDTGVTGSRY